MQTTLFATMYIVRVFKVLQYGLDIFADLTGSQKPKQAILKTQKLVKIALCSRNFQNVKLRLDFFEIKSFYRHSNFT